MFGTETGKKIKCVKTRYAPLAQLDRASGYEPGGRRFESCRAHQILPHQSLPQQSRAMALSPTNLWVELVKLLEIKALQAAV